MKTRNFSLTIFSAFFGMLSFAQTYTFTNCTATGMNGPTQAMVNTEYLATNLNGLVVVNTQGYQEWTVPATGTYTIEAYGASGGGISIGTPGQGAVMIGDFSLTSGQVLKILVGQEGGMYGNSSGGGGGSFVTDLANNPYIVAGAGSGVCNSEIGEPGLTTTTGGGYNPGSAGNGGDCGGAGSGSGSGAGGGLLTTGSSCTYGGGGLAYVAGGTGGNNSGGFGGGGGNTNSGINIAGGGGGYSGGSGNFHPGTLGTGGGGSYNSGANQTNTSGTNVGMGLVVISLSCSPTILTADLTLTDVVDECSMAMPTPPTATNDCGVTFNGTTVTVFPITAQGTTVVTWSYDDGQGNTTSQTQNVILTDVTAPVADSTSLPDLSDMCGVSSVTAPTATDNCAGQITGTTTTTFPVTTPGASVITWTFDDGQGNVSTQTQNILNGAIEVGISQTGTQLNADALVAAYQWLDCDNNYSIIAGEANQYYTPSVTGSYAVEITQGGCVDTSACVLVDFTGIEEMNLQGLSMYPNPTSGMMTINFNGEVKNIEVVDMVGRLISLPTSITDKTVDATQLTAGKYMIRLTTENDQVLVKEFVVQN